MMLDEIPPVRDVETCLRELAALGFTSTAVVEPGGMVSCRECGKSVSARDVEILAVRRLEGATDPTEEKIILGLRCVGCGQKAVAVLTYGPSASTDDADVLQLLDTVAWRANAR